MKEFEPKVSVLLSYYKGERYLEGFLKNLQEQTIFFDTELVFVGCLLTDTEKKTLEKFQEEHCHPSQVKLIDLDTLEPQSTCWNIAITEATSSYVCIWNIDDQRTPYSLEKQWKKLKVEPETTLATYGYFIISNTFLGKTGKFIDHSLYSKEEYERSMLLGPFFMFRKSVCEDIGYFDEQLRSGSDYDFAIRLAKHGNIKMINSIDGYFLDEGRGLSTGGNQLQPIERTLVELRYGLHDKVDQRFVDKTKGYRQRERLQFGKWIPNEETQPQR